MSISPPTNTTRSNSDPAKAFPEGLGPRKRYSDGLKRRLPFYGAALFVVVFGLAWMDGGEEPIHPIAHAVELESVGLETN
ncbi:MAG: hypothetical protein AAF687_09345 [Pseudomonadota bacterium]